jgi:hypothetical protein
LGGHSSAPGPDPSVSSTHAKEYLPLDHEKYQGIAAAKGYKQGEEFSGNRLQKVSYSHEAMIDVILTNPTITQNELAVMFGKTRGWISIVMGSDAFQGALAKRRDDVTNPELIATIEERFRGVVDQSLQIISEKLDLTKNTDLALKALDIGSKALGFGARGPTTQNNNTFVVALPPKMDTGEWAAAHAKPAGPLIEVRAND